MRVTVNREVLAEILTPIAKLASKNRGIKPILDCAKLSTQEWELRVEATNLVQCLSGGTAQVEINEPSPIAVDASRLLAALRALDDDTVTLEAEEERLVIKGSSAKLKLPTLPADTFPPIPTQEIKKPITLKFNDLTRLIRQVKYAMADDNTRYVWNAIQFVANGSLRAAASEGHTIGTAFLMGDHGPRREMIMPGSMADLILGLPGVEGEVQICANDGRFFFRSDEWEASASLLEGAFPPLDDILSCVEATTTCRLDAEIFRRAIATARLACDEQSNGVRLAVSNKGLRISAASPQAGEAEIYIPCKVDGPGLEIGINPDFLMDIAANGETEDVELGFSAPNRPARIKYGETYKCIISPINLK